MECLFDKEYQEYFATRDINSLWQLIEKYGPSEGFNLVNVLKFVQDYASNNPEYWQKLDFCSTIERNPEDKIQNSTFKLMSTSYEKEIERRDCFIYHFSWAIPSRGGIQELAKFIGDTPTVEINSGSGLWACLLLAKGCNIVATDLHPWDQGFMEVKEIDASAAMEKYLPENGCLMTCWPNYNDPYATNALKVALKKNLQKAVLIGEEVGCCTGDEELYSLLDSTFPIKQEIEIPTWPFIHDRIYLYSR